MRVENVRFMSTSTMGSVCPDHAAMMPEWPHDVFEPDRWYGIPASDFPGSFSQMMRSIVEQEASTGKFGNKSGYDSGGGNRDYGLEIHKFDMAAPLAVAKKGEDEYWVTFFARATTRDLSSGGSGEDCSDYHWLVAELVVSTDEAFRITSSMLTEQLVRKWTPSFDERTAIRSRVLKEAGLSDECLRIGLWQEVPDHIKEQRNTKLRPHNLDNEAPKRMRASFLRQFSEAYGEAANSEDPIADMFVFKDTLSPPD
jgi:hypothetical protein